MSLAGCLTIDPDAIAANWRALDRLSGPEVETAAVVKADGYGCGAAAVAPALARAGARSFFVAQPAGGAALRGVLGPAPAIYVLAGYAAEDEPLFRAHALAPVLNSREQADAWFPGRPGAPAAVQLDTGMNRLGMEPGEIPALPRDGSVSLVMSHLACADEPGHAMNPVQLTEFRRLLEHIGPGIRASLAATGGVLLGSDYHFDLVRPGVGLFGGQPFAGARQVVGLTLPVIQLRDVAPGEAVGYGATWRAARPTRIATLSGGYADGLLRALGNSAVAWHRGRPLPFAGRVSMDLVTVDASAAPDLAPGDRVEILGPHQGVDALAAAAGTIGYEILTGLGSRYRRRYRDAGSEERLIPPCPS